MLQVITALLLTHAAPGSVSPTELAPAIVATATRHSVDAVLLTQVLLVESRGKATAINHESDDHGLMQINERTRELYGFSKWCVKQWQCNLNAGAKVLADALRIKNGRPCVYNGGPRFRLEKYAFACDNYERKLATIN